MRNERKTEINLWFFKYKKTIKTTDRYELYRMVKKTVLKAVMILHLIYLLSGC